MSAVTPRDARSGLTFCRILVEDTTPSPRRVGTRAQGHGVVEARDESEALQAMRQNRPGVVLTDLKLPDGDGFGVLRAAKELDPAVQVVVMTAYGSIQDAVAAMKEGAMDFLAKPVDPEHLLLMVERALAQRRLFAENTLLKEELAERRGAPRIIGEDPSLRMVLQHLHRASATDATVLLEGESGTGKELFARTLHPQPAPGRAVRVPSTAPPFRKRARDRALRAREGRVHRCHGAQARPLRGGAPRHAVPGRDRDLPLALQAKISGARGESFERRRHAVVAPWTYAVGGHHTAT